MNMYPVKKKKKEWIQYSRKFASKWQFYFSPDYFVHVLWRTVCIVCVCVCFVGDNYYLLFKIVFSSTSMQINVPEEQNRQNGTQSGF